MTHISTNNVPRESYRRRIGRWFLDLMNGLRQTQPRPHQPKRPSVPNERMVELNPHLLRDIGITDFNAPRRHQ